jgi:transposase
VKTRVFHNNTSIEEEEAPMEREYVGIDFHRRRSVIVRMNQAGERLSVVRVANEPAVIADAVTAAGREPQVVIEATYGWYWVVDLLQELGATVHLANPNALNWGERRVKNDVVDATDLADMLRLGRLPEAWIAPPGLRELRELVRYRAKLVRLRSGLKAQVHAVMAKQGVLPGVVDMFGPAGQVQLDEMGLDRPYRMRVESLRELIEVYNAEIVRLEREIHAHLSHHPGYRAVQAINGVGRTIAAILVAEIGDVTRFPTPRHLCSWAGLTPGRRESDRKGHDTDITKHGSRLLRWAVIEGISRYHGGPHLAAEFHRLADRRGTNKARVAIARRVLTLAYYGLRDREIRCLAEPEAA